MEIKIGSIVTRKSHNNDVIFKVMEIRDTIAYLKGTDVRLYADAPIDDLIISNKKDEFRPDIASDLLDRDEYFYLPGKILHIDAVLFLCNKKDYFSTIITSFLML